MRRWGDGFLRVGYRRESAIICASGGAVIKGQEAMTVVSLMLFVESSQVAFKAAIKQDEDSHNR